VLVCGGRDYGRQPGEPEHFAARMAACDAVLPGGITCVVEGYARGADTMARLWAIANGRELCTMPADWATYGPQAGPIRNGLMLSVGRPALVLAFPGHAGTANMVRQARAAGVTVWMA
jgi:hypothetical protein